MIIKKYTYDTIIKLIKKILQNILSNIIQKISWEILWYIIQLVLIHCNIPQQLIDEHKSFCYYIYSNYIYPKIVKIFKKLIVIIKEYIIDVKSRIW